MGVMLRPPSVWRRMSAWERLCSSARPLLRGKCGFPHANLAFQAISRPLLSQVGGVVPRCSTALAGPLCAACLVAQLCLHRLFAFAQTLCNAMDFSTPGSSPGKNTGVGCHALLQGIFPTQELDPGLPHCRQFLYHLSHREPLIDVCVCIFPQTSSLELSCRFRRLLPRQRPLPRSVWASGDISLTSRPWLGSGGPAATPASPWWAVSDPSRSPPSLLRLYARTARYPILAWVRAAETRVFLWPERRLRRTQGPRVGQGAKRPGALPTWSANRLEPKGLNHTRIGKTISPDGRKPQRSIPAP